MGKKNDILIITLAIVSLVSLSAQSESLDLKVYLDQVRTANTGVQALETQIRGYEQKLREGDQVWTPIVGLGATYSKDDRETMNPSFMGSSTKYNSENINVGKNFKTGTRLELGFGLERFVILNSLLPQPEYHSVGPTIKFTQDLWRNLAGQEWKSDSQAAYFQNMSAMFSAKAQWTQAIADAEITYWKLSLAREIVRVQKEILDRAQKIKGWASRRENLRLSDTADKYQAEAAVLGRELDLQNAIDEELLASKYFNHLRSRVGTEVTETLAPPPVTSENIQIKSSIEEREDYQAMKAQLSAAKESSKVGYEKNRPVFQVFGSYTLNGHHPDFDTAMEKGWTTEHPMFVIGAKFTFSLDWDLSSRNRQGYRLIEQGVQSQLDRKKRDLLNDYESLSVKHDQVRKRLGMAQNLEKAQKQKRDYEKERLLRGRTTTYQVLLFEQDFATAELIRLKTQLEMIQIVTQLKTFGGSSEFR